MKTDTGIYASIKNKDLIMLLNRNWIDFFNRNWIVRTKYLVWEITSFAFHHYFPSEQWGIIDSKHVLYLSTTFGDFHYDKTLKDFPRVFEEVSSYHMDISNNDVVCDIGANIGVFTIAAAKKAKHVYAVEPLFLNELQRNIELNKSNNVTCLEYALTDGNNFEIDFLGRKKTCIGKTLTQILAECNIKPNFLKMDCEGGEWYIKPEDLTSFNRIEAEIHDFNNANANVHYDPMVFVKMIKSLGFTCETNISNNLIILHAKR